MGRHRMTHQAEIAVARASRALSRLKAREVALKAEIAEAEDDLRAAQYDLSINVRLDEAKGE
jgi:multidrug resistance efflux pump